MSDYKPMTYNESKLLVAHRLREMLNDIGVRGPYTITANRIDAPVLFTFNFNDPKDQFLFELRGGSARYSKIVVGIAKEYLDEVGNWK